MSSSIRVSNSRPTATAATVVADRLHVTLADGREIIVPVEGGEGIWWEQLDEGVSVPGLLGLPHV
jgi:hypothetical protein